MFEGNLEDGELEIGQVSAYINDIVSAKEVVDELISGCKLALERVNDQFDF
jgi:enoyl-[acyl-carrier protein] reductase II